MVRRRLNARFGFLIKGRRKGHYRTLASGKRVWVRETTTKVEKKASSPKRGRKKRSRAGEVEEAKKAVLVDAEPWPFGYSLDTVVKKARKFRKKWNKAPVFCPAIKKEVFFSKRCLTYIEDQSKNNKDYHRRLRLLPVAYEVVSKAKAVYRTDKREGLTKKGKKVTTYLYTVLGRYKESPRAERERYMKVIIREIVERAKPSIIDLYVIE